MSRLTLWATRAPFSCGTLGDGGRHLPVVGVEVLIDWILIVLAEGCSAEGKWRGINSLELLISLTCGNRGCSGDMEEASEHLPHGSILEWNRWVIGHTYNLSGCSPERLLTLCSHWEWVNFPTSITPNLKKGDYRTYRLDYF